MNELTEFAIVCACCAHFVWAICNIYDHMHDIFFPKKKENNGS